MNILLTNDDGFHEYGIKLLKEILQDFGTVYTVAPSIVKSGTSASLTLRKKMKLIKYDQYNYELDGTPVDCVCYGLNALNVKFDLVVSGCNNGYNLSFDAVYSGTLGACFQAMVQDIPTFAFSTDVNNFDIVKKYGKIIIKDLFAKELLSSQYILNINFPNKEFQEIKGYKITKQHFRKVQYEHIEDEQGVISLRTITDDGSDPCLDTVAVKEGFVSITPLQKTSFSIELFKKLNKEEK